MSLPLDSASRQVATSNGPPPRLHPALRAALETLEGAGVRWCVLRGAHEIGDRLGDTDLLVDPRRLAGLPSLLEPLGFVNVPLYAPPTHRHVVSYRREDDCWIWLHAVSELSFGPDSCLRTHAANGVLERRRYREGVAVPAPDDDLWITLSHCLLDKGSVAPRHRERLDALASGAGAGGDLARVIQSVLPGACEASNLVAWVQAGEWDKLERVAATMRRTCEEKTRDRFWPSSFLRAARRARRLRGLWDRRGMRVALLGPDGAGKSTLSSGLEGSFIFPVRTIYMGLTGGLLPWADRLRFPPLVVPARLAIFWYRYVRGRYEQMRGRLVIFDRYVYDSRVPHPRQLSRLERAVRWIDGHSVPGPDLVLVLSAPGDVMHARKGEYSSETLELWRRHFLALRERIPNLEIVDTTQDPEAVRAEVTQRIWNRYRARWRVSPVEPGT